MDVATWAGSAAEGGEEAAVDPGPRCAAWQRRPTGSARRDRAGLTHSAAVARVSASATRLRHMAAMTKTNAGKARWARTKAAGLWQQGTELDRDRTGSWEDRARRRRAADRLRTEAARFASIARRLDPSLDDQVA